MAEGRSEGAAVTIATVKATYNRSACTECQRRKQKCNREWPCDRCQRRKIADECRYNYSNPALDAPRHDLAEKLKRTHDDYANRTAAVAEESNAEVAGSFDALATRLYATLGIDHGMAEQPTTPKQDFVTADSSPQMQRVLHLLPSRRSMDTLMQDFFSDINHHYYIIYPPVFLQDYHIWWDARCQQKPLSLQHTCLLAIVCACALQHVDGTSAVAMKRELSDSPEAVSEKLHGAMRELASVIPVGHYHFLNVQRLLHSCYWYKAEAKFLEAWHVLSAAILEAQELSYHKDPPSGSVSDFDLEMRRRLWCILDTWDWQISSGLSRPKIVDRTDCDAQLPTLTLEGHAVSPLLHMKMQSQLTRQLAKRFSAPKDIIAPVEVHEYKCIIEDWVQHFPPEYSFEEPDTSKDGKYPWLWSHRFYVYTMACLLILNPIRHYMVKQYSWTSPKDELEIRQVGIRYSLKLMETMRKWVDKIYNRDGRLHFIIFSIFDTAAILCTALFKDSEHTLANRQEVLASISDAVNMLRKLNRISKTSKTSFDILERLVKRLPCPVPCLEVDRHKKRMKVSAATTNPSGTPSRRSLPSGAPPPPPPPPSVSISAGSVPHQAAYPQQTYLPSPPTAQAWDSRPASVPATTNNTTPPLRRAVATASPAAVDLAPRTYDHYGGTGLMRSNSIPRNVNHVVPDDSTHAVPQNHHVFVVDPSSAGNNATYLANQQQAWSTASNGTPPNMAPSSFVPMTETSCLDTTPFDQKAPDPGPDFNIENLTDAQLGELAPLWNWHSSNLDFANMAPPPLPVPNLFPGPI